MIRRIGDRVILVGVAHVLPESKIEVEELIREEKPEIVAVELCYRRYISLISNQKSRGPSGFEFSRRAILARFLGFIQERIGEKTGMFPGEEMLTAVRNAGEVDAKVELIDRDINITLQRLLDRTSLWEKLRILFSFLVSSLQLGEELNLKDLTDEEVVRKLIASFKNLSETSYEVLIGERDHYMADRICALTRARTGNIICVVGAGHIPGLTKELKSRLTGEPP